MNEVSWIDTAIENWVRWHKAGGNRLRCFSIESAYRSPQRSHWPDDAPPYEIRVVSYRAGWAVERAWRALPFVPKMVLKWWYVKKKPAGWICRWFKKKSYPVEVKYWDMEIARAKHLLGGKLAKEDLSYENRGIASGVVMAQQGGPGAPSRRLGEYTEDFLLQKFATL